MGLMPEQLRKIDAIKLFRERTGLGLAEAKTALEQADYNLDKALLIARSWPAPVRKTGKEGHIFSYTHQGRIGVLLELCCETDFVARSPEFQTLGKNLCLHVAADELFNRRASDEGTDWEQPYVRDSSITVEQLLKDYSAKVKERVEIIKVTRWVQGVITNG